MQRKAVVLLSGGVHSSLCLHLARSQGYMPYALSLDIPKRSFQLESAQQVAQEVVVAEHQVVAMNENSLSESKELTYYSSLLSFAVNWAQTLSAQDIFIGIHPGEAHSLEFMMEWLQSYQELVNLTATTGIRIQTPLLFMSDKKRAQTAKQFDLTLPMSIQPKKKKFMERIFS
ncbi:7-cyano-7-deazaguanine synthase [Piscirickettsia litoralis]|uniref:7-cyano-7-deazaguanine synthase n=1 Tax=Piscirickettsia litoralis TaxID=1891921 RepID=A0ABX3A0U7_9GAMM|nr:7-cyano-7-deazaguanine synthase [Piscirickettsia litoralis]ODN42249.1 exsB family protein [Piscirickettsia litoralis]